MVKFVTKIYGEAKNKTLYCRIYLFSDCNQRLQNDPVDTISSETWLADYKKLKVANAEYIFLAA